MGPNANINIQVDKGNLNLVVKDGTFNTNVNGDYNMKVNGNYNLDVRGNLSETVSGTKTSNTTKSVTHRGQTFTVTANRIDLN